MRTVRQILEEEKLILAQRIRDAENPELAVDINRSKQSVDDDRISLSDGLHALNRLDDGKYGVCDECDEPIEGMRLAINLAERFCSKHAGGRQSSLPSPQELSREAALRAAVIDRDGGVCVLCGNPGTEVDHIGGSSPDLANLQLLCHSCHQKKTAASFRPIEPGSPQEALRIELDIRIAVPRPMRQCDDEKAWPTLWRELAAERKALVRSN